MSTTRHMTQDDPARTVVMVLDAEYGEKLRELWAGQPVWITMSPVNMPVIKELWNTSKNPNSLTCISGMRHDSKRPPHEQFRYWLGTIDDHHDRYASPTPYTRLRVIGLALTDDSRSLLHCLGFSRFETSREGFVADRSAEEAKQDHDLPT